MADQEGYIPEAEQLQSRLGFIENEAYVQGARENAAMLGLHGEAVQERLGGILHQSVAVVESHRSGVREANPLNPGSVIDAETLERAYALKGHLEFLRDSGALKVPETPPIPQTNITSEFSS